MRVIPRLAVILALCVMTLGLLPTPVEAQVCRDPKIELSPNRGVPGDTITIDGKDFDPDGYVDIYYHVDSPTGTPLKESTIPNSSRKFRVDVVIPESYAGTHTIRAVGRVDGEIVEKDALFTVIPGLTVSPTHGPIGATITVSGNGFAANETGIEVRRGLYETLVQNVQADGRGSWEATFTLPAWSRGQHEIRALGSVHAIIQGVRPAMFRVGPGISVAGESGAVGQEVAVSGTGFAANERNIRILIAGEIVTTIPASISADATGRWEAAFVVPEKPAGEYAVAAAGEHTRQSEIDEVPFEISPALAISPDEGHVGMEVAVSGQGFPAGKPLVIIYGDEKVAEAIVDYEGSFEKAFTVPESRYGQHEVWAAISESPNSVSDLVAAATAVFVMESDPPPVPEQLSPTDGHRIGFFRRAAPEFEWTDVFDPSGVYYNLRVATSPDFNQGSVVFTRTGLTDTAYSVNDGDALANGVYYWSVQAVDGAQNESAWTDAVRFRVGRLPMWGFIAIFSFVGLLLGLRTYFILVRPRLYD